MLIIIATVEHLLSMSVFDQTQFAVLSDLFILVKQGLLISGDKDNKDNIFYYINCSALASGSKSRKMVSHMCG